ncbi:MAG: DUF697 domain-containing protein [Stellaceae bacterium]
MNADTEAPTRALRPRIVETGETGRLELGLPASTEPAIARSARGQRRSPFAWALGGLALLALSAAAIDLESFVAGGFARGPGFGVAAAVAVAAAAGGAGYWVLSELRGLWRLRSAERLRQIIPTALASELKRELAEAAAILGRDPLLAAPVARYKSALDAHHSAADALVLFSRFVLAPADQLAQAAIRRAAAQAFAINLVSPTMLTDTLFFAARALRLVREIAQIYGQRPGLAGTVHLLRQLIGGAGLVGAVDVVGGVLVQQLGGAVLERISASAAESAYAAQKMARLGLLSMALCRPVGFAAGETPSLTALLSGLLKSGSDKTQEADPRRRIG